MRYVATASAKKDIREIFRHISRVQKSPQNAALVAERLRLQFRKLAETPGMGHARQELRDETAGVIEVSGVLLIYDPTLKPLTNLRVIHGSRDLGNVTPR